MDEICTVSLHSSYTAENLHIIHNKTNGMQKFYHPLSMTALRGVRSCRMTGKPEITKGSQMTSVGWRRNRPNERIAAIAGLCQTFARMFSAVRAGMAGSKEVQMGGQQGRITAGRKTLYRA